MALLAALAGFGCSGCTASPNAGVSKPAVPGLACVSGESPWVLGQAWMGAGQADADAWQGFVAHDITPRFPAGFTILQAQGQWRAPDGRVMQEPSRILQVLVPDAAQARQGLVAIAAAYRRAFHQQSVLIGLQPLCLRDDRG